MCHVLIIEDEPLTAMLLQDVLEEAGATSFAFAATEQEAIDQANEHVPSVITSDVNLSEGYGPRAVEHIQRALGAIPVIFITATPDADCLCGVGRLLRKPFNAGQLTSAFLEVAPLQETR
jgi:CheY-like chemotaxis protein